MPYIHMFSGVIENKIRTFFIHGIIRQMHETII